MALAGLVLGVSHQRLLVAESGGYLRGISNQTATIAAYVEYHALAEHKVEDDLVEVAIADRRIEAATIYIADVIVEYLVFQSAGYAVVGAQVPALQGVAEVAGVVFVPSPVAAVVEGGAQVYVAVAQFAEHIGEHLEQLLATDAVPRAYLIYIIYIVPVYILVIKEAVVLVHDLPQGLEVALGGIFVLDFVYARSEEER